MTSNLFSIVFTKKPVPIHKNFAKLRFDEPLKKNRNNPQRRPYRQIKNINRKQKPLAPIGAALLVVGLFIVAYSINQTFFSTSVINDEQKLLENQFEVNNTNLSDLRTKNLNAENSVGSLEQIDEFQESFISIATKTLTNQAAKAEFLPDVVGDLVIVLPGHGLGWDSDEAPEVLDDLIRAVIDVIMDSLFSLHFKYGNGFNCR